MGSEMCIRDSAPCTPAKTAASSASSSHPSRSVGKVPTGPEFGSKVILIRFTAVARYRQFGHCRWVRLQREEQLKIVRICEHSFVEDWISGRSLVVDLGLNQGAFASAIAERYGCRIIGAEPDPTFFETLPDIKGLEKESIAIGGSNGVAKLHLNTTCCSSTIFKENEKEA